MRTPIILIGILIMQATSAQPSAQPSYTNAIPLDRGLRAGEFYFRTNSMPGFLIGRNVTELTPEAFERDFVEMEKNGERVVRLHLMHGIPPSGAAGKVDDVWAAKWDRVFESAEKHHISIIPVFTVWAQWNDGSRGELWHVWNDNPYNINHGGPARLPNELLGDTECRRIWLQWLSELVKRWHIRRNIIAWEPISELDLVTGSESGTVGSFIESAARAVRSADPEKRPVTVSLSGTVDWPEVNGSKAIDIVQTHPYAAFPPYQGNLDELILDSVRDRLKRYGKPVMIGECGLDFRPPANTLTVSKNAQIGIRNAIWASVVSGALNGRMLWWEDGYGKYEHADITEIYRNAAAPMTRFANGVRFDDLKPVETIQAKELKGAALSSNKLVVGWFRDAQCAAPDWPLRQVTGESVTVSMSGVGERWSVRFYDTSTGNPVGPATETSCDGRLIVTLPEFHESIAFVARKR